VSPSELALVAFITAIDLWSIARIGASEARWPAKGAWVAAVVLLPILGFAAWILSGPKPPRRHTEV
jgi:hypothetical protein